MHYSQHFSSCGFKYHTLFTSFAIYTSHSYQLHIFHIHIYSDLTHILFTSIVHRSTHIHIYDNRFYSPINADISIRCSCSYSRFNSLSLGPILCNANQSTILFISFLYMHMKCMHDMFYHSFLNAFWLG